MKTKSIIVALLLALVLALSAFAACDKQGAEHKSDGVYQSDDYYHWHGCTACDEHIYDKAPHEFVADGAQKKCNVCGKNIQNAEDSDEVMALYWLAARDGTKAYNGAYAVNHTEDRIEDDGQWHYVAKESCDGGDNYTVGDQGGSYSHLKNYNVVSFNGEEWDTPAPAKFTVESGKVYVIVVQYVDND